MKISIVTISYNQAKFLEKTICSVLDQDYLDLEYIMVDPGSMDGSRNIIEKYKDRISNIILEPDNGPADGLNKAFDLASGEMYGFLNSDDLLLPGTLQKVSDFFLNHPDIDAVSADAIVVGPDEEHIRRIHPDHFSLTRYAYRACSIVQPSTFFRRSIFEKVGGFNPYNRIAWDGELFVDMALAGANFALARDLWSAHRVHPNSITGTLRYKGATLEYRRQIFLKIMGRPFSWIDYPLLGVSRLIKHLQNPKGLLERLTKGPVAGRFRPRTTLPLFRRNYFKPLLRCFHRLLIFFLEIAP